MLPNNKPIFLTKYEKQGQDALQALIYCFIPANNDNILTEYRGREILFGEVLNKYWGLMLKPATTERLDLVKELYNVTDDEKVTEITEQWRFGTLPLYAYFSENGDNTRGVLEAQVEEEIRKASYSLATTASQYRQVKLALPFDATTQYTLPNSDKYIQVSTQYACTASKVEVQLTFSIPAKGAGCFIIPELRNKNTYCIGESLNKMWGMASNTAFRRDTIARSVTFNYDKEDVIKAIRLLREEIDKVAAININTLMDVYKGNVTA